MTRGAPERGFPTAEYEARLTRAQQHMHRAGLDGLLLMTEPEVRYFSGFHTAFWQSPTRPWFLFVPKDGDGDGDGKPVAVIPEIGLAVMERTWIDDIRTWPAPRPDDDGLTLLADLLQPIAARGGSVGLLKGHETLTRMPLGDLERLQNSLPGLQFKDCTEIIRSLRMVKSSLEIDKIAHICGIASESFAEAPALFHQGQPLIESFRAFRMACLRNGADDVPYLVGGADQGGYRDIISPPSARPLENGDILMLDTGAVFDGYFCDFDRNFAIGSASDDARRAYDALHKAVDAGLEAARPGITCSDLFRAMQKALGDAGYDAIGDVGRFGHGLGMQLTEWPSHAAFDETVLEENMVLTLEPSLTYGDGLTMVHEENIVVQDGTPRLLTTRAPDHLPVL
ncbi:M24 family metallopeptidase [Coralliovum pocilloporae]|uniref:M24 family metallopeptidase n=1 Tax=Coralliovum pocilloporae TaxID=3066369 RepID=UPI0033071A26